MMTLEALLQYLSEHNIRLALCEEQTNIRVHSAEHKLSENAKAALLHHKSVLIRHLQTQFQSKPQAGFSPDKSAQLNDEKLQLRAPSSFPLSAAQLAIYLHLRSLTDDQKITYELPLALSLPLATPLNAIQSALECLYCEFPLLYSQFRNERGSIIQFIDSSCPSPHINVHALTLTNQQEIEQQWQHFKQSAYCDIEQGKLLHCEVYASKSKCSDNRHSETSQEHLLFIKIHHLISDIHSAQLLLNRFSFYLNQCINSTEALESYKASITPQYDYLIEQLSHLNTHKPAASLPQQSKANTLEALFNAAQAHDFFHSQSAAALCQSIEHLQQHAKASAFSVFFALSAVAIKHFSGQQAFEIHIAHSGRKPQNQKTLGLYVSHIGVAINFEDAYLKNSPLTLKAFIRYCQQQIFESIDRAEEKTLNAANPVKILLTYQLSENDSQAIFIHENKELAFKWLSFDDDSSSLINSAAIWPLHISLDHILAHPSSYSSSHSSSHPSNQPSTLHLESGEKSRLSLQAQAQCNQQFLASFAPFVQTLATFALANSNESLHTMLRHLAQDQESFQTLLKPKHTQAIAPSINQITDQTIGQAKSIQGTGQEQDKKTQGSEAQEPESALLEFSRLGEKILAIFTEVLHRPLNPKLLQSNFTELGGHSLAALAISQAIYENFQQHVALESFFKQSSLLALIHTIEKQIISAASKALVSKINKAPEDFQKPNFAQVSLLRFESLQANSAVYHLPIAFKLKANSSKALKTFNKILEACIHHQLNKHDNLRTIFPDYKQAKVLDKSCLSDKTLVQVHALNHASAIDTDQSHALIQQAIAKPFKLDSQLPFRVELFCHQNQALLLLTFHHIAADAISLHLLAKELYELLKTPLEQGLSSTYIEHEPAYRYSAQDYAFLQEQDYQNNIHYWLTQLKAIPAYIALPDLSGHSDHSYPSVVHSNTQASSVKLTTPIDQAFKSDSIKLSLSSEQSNNLCQVASKLSCSLYTLLLSSYQLVIQAISNENAFASAIALNGRPQALHNTPGMMVNTIPFIFKIDKHDISFTDFIHRQTQQLQQALKHQHISLELLAEKLSIVRESQQLPFAQTGFNFLNHDSSLHQGIDSLAQFKMGDIDFSLVDFPSEQHQNDLNLTASAGHKAQEDFSIQFKLSYKLSRFSKAQAQSYLDAFSHLLTFLSTNESNLDNKTLSLSDCQKALKDCDFSSSNQQALALSSIQEEIYLDALISQDYHKNHIGFVTFSTSLLDAECWRQAVYHCYRHFAVLNSLIHSDDNMHFYMQSNHINEALFYRPVLR